MVMTSAGGMAHRHDPRECFVLPFFWGGPGFVSLKFCYFFGGF